MDQNVSFYDLSPEERAAAHDRAERETGSSLYDLSPEERGRYYDAAEREAGPASRYNRP